MVCGETITAALFVFLHNVAEVGRILL